MRKNFGKKTWLYPMPVLIVTTYNEDGTPNAMNAAWGGVYDTDRDHALPVPGSPHDREYPCAGGRSRSA